MMLKATRSRKNSRPLKVFVADFTLWKLIGFAESAEAFRRIIDVGQSTISVTWSTAPEHLALAEEAGVGFFVRLSRRLPTEVFDEKEILEGRDTMKKRILQATRDLASGQGNQPFVSLMEVRVPVPSEKWRELTRPESSEPFRIKIDENISVTVPQRRDPAPTEKTKKRFSIGIDGETRGYWERVGSEWCLHDMTDTLVRVTRSFHFSTKGFHEVVAPPDRPDFHARISPWDEALALKFTLQAWEDGALPTVAAQVDMAALRAQTQEKKHREKLVIAHLARHFEALERVLKGAEANGIPEARELLSFFSGGNQETLRNTSMDSPDSSDSVNLAEPSSTPRLGGL